MKKAALIILFTIFVFSLAFGGVGFTDLQIRLMPPSSEHPFGTDMLGRDILSRCALGTLISILIASSVTAISLAFGILLSFLYLHPSFHEGIILSVSDSLKSIPSIVLALFISAIAGPGIAVLVISLSLSHISDISRTSYAESRRISKEGYVEAARAMNGSTRWIFLHHVLPNMKGYLYEQGISVFLSSIIAESSLSFLGCGVPQPLPSLGSILSDARPVMTEAWWMILFPALIILLLAASLQILGSKPDTTAH